MLRSSVGKTLIGLVLSIFAGEALSQNIPEPLASVSSDSDEASGWMQLEIAIFVDTSDETLSSELWEIEPELSYPANRRWLTDYAEIKALMDQWGETAVKLDTNGAIAIVPEPPESPDPTPTPTSADNPANKDNLEAIWQAEGSREALSRLPITSNEMQEALAAHSGVSDKSSDETDESALTAVFESDTGELSNLAREKAIKHLETSGSSFKTLATSEAGKVEESPSVDVLERSGAINASEPGGSLPVVTLQTSNSSPNGSTKIALENLQTSETDDPLGRSGITAFEGDIDNSDNSANIALDNSQISDGGSFETGFANQLLENLDSSEPIAGASDKSFMKDGRTQASAKTGNFFAIEGLGEDFNGLTRGGETRSGPAENQPSAETIDWLSDFDTEEPAEGAMLAAEPTPPPLPASYQLMPLEMLPQGLKQLQKDTGRQPVSIVSWLQPTSGKSDAVVVDSWTDESTLPDLQGTVRISGPSDESRQFRLSMNLWANTTGRYLPEKLPAIAVPTPPTRILLIEPQSKNKQEVDEPTVEFVDIATGLNTVSSPQDIEGTDPKALISPSIKHAVLLNETRDLREGYVRYIDHPVIQVAAVWRELSYAELYELGEAQRVRRDIDRLTRSLITAQSDSGLSETKKAPTDVNQ